MLTKKFENLITFVEECGFAVVKIPTETMTLEFDEDDLNGCVDCRADMAFLKPHKDAEVHSVSVDNGTIIEADSLKKMRDESKELYAMLYENGYLVKKEFQ